MRSLLSVGAPAYWISISLTIGLLSCAETAGIHTPSVRVRMRRKRCLKNFIGKNLVRPLCKRAGGRRTAVLMEKHLLKGNRNFTLENPCKAALVQRGESTRSASDATHPTP